MEFMTEAQLDALFKSIHDQVFTDHMYIEGDDEYVYTEDAYVFPFSNLSDSQMEWIFYEDYEPRTHKPIGYLFRGQWFPTADEES
jgi:hypothetical protein